MNLQARDSGLQQPKNPCSAGQTPRPRTPGGASLTARCGLTIEQNDRNPRRIKRFLNGFTLEYALDAEWERLGAELLVRVLIIDVYFPEFARLLRGRQMRDPVEDIRQYSAVRDIVRRHRRFTDDDEQRITAAFDWFGIAAPSNDPDKLLEVLEREVPPSFPKLAQNSEFLALLAGLGDVERLREKLRRYSPTTVRQRGKHGRVFFVYRREDSAALTRRLSEALAPYFGIEGLFLDVMSIEPGADWQTTIATAARSAPVVLVVIGQNWVGPWLDHPSDIMRIELATVLTRPDARVIPVLVAGAELPNRDQLPDDLAPLLTRQAIVISDDHWERDVEALIEVIDRWATLTQGVATLIDKVPWASVAQTAASVASGLLP